MGLTSYKTDTKQKKRNDIKNVLDKSFSVSICDLCCSFKRSNHHHNKHTYRCISRNYTICHIHDTARYIKSTTLKHSKTDTKQKKRSDKKNVLDKSFSVSICDLCCSFKRCNHHHNKHTYSLQNRHETKQTTKRTC